MLERLLSLFGLALILFMAWAWSYHRSKVKIKTVAWGLGLQFVFALIILRDDAWSFVGLGILTGLLVCYVFRDQVGSWGGKAVGFAIVIGAAGLATLMGYWSSQMMAFGWVLMVFVLGAGLNDYLKNTSRQPYLLGALFALTVGYLMQHELHGQVLFKAFSDKIAAFLSLSDYGAQFLFANLADSSYYFTDQSTWPGFGFLFAFKVLPTIIFFGGFMGVLYYFGVMQVIIQAVSRFMRWTIGTSGAETLSCSANIFVGQTEAPLLIRPFLAKMTNSELLTVMVGGFATIAGGVLAGYISMGVNAGHLVAASVMSAPAALVLGKILFPETEHSVTAGDVEMPEINVGSNPLEAASNGITDGLKLAVNVGAMLIGFIALIAVIDVVLNFADSIIDGQWLGGSYYTYRESGLSPAKGEFAGYFPGSLQTFFGNVLKYLAMAMGVPSADAAAVGNLLGIKLSLNEFVAFGLLGSYIQDEVISGRAQIISTYALCGFANFSSIGIQIGGIAALAPERRSDLAKLGLKAMFGGAFASWTTATIAGILVA